MRAAAPLRGPLIAHGLPKSFLTDLRDRLDAFERATHDRLSALEMCAAAAAGLGTAMARATHTLTRLDAIVANTLRAEPRLLQTWTTLRRVPRSRATRRRAEVPAGA